MSTNHIGLIEAVLCTFVARCEPIACPDNNTVRAQKQYQSVTARTTSDSSLTKFYSSFTHQCLDMTSRVLLAQPWLRSNSSGVQTFCCVADRNSEKPYIYQLCLSSCMCNLMPTVCELCFIQLPYLLNLDALHILNYRNDRINKFSKFEIEIGKLICLFIRSRRPLTWSGRENVCCSNTSSTYHTQTILTLSSPLLFNSIP